MKIIEMCAKDEHRVPRLSVSLDHRQFMLRPSRLTMWLKVCFQQQKLATTELFHTMITVDSQFCVLNLCDFPG